MINMLLTNLTPTKDVRLRSNKFGIVVGTLALCSLDNENLIISLQNQISQTEKPNLSKRLKEN